MNFEWILSSSVLNSAQICLRDRCSPAFYMDALRGKAVYSGFTDYERPGAYAAISSRIDIPHGFYGSPKCLKSL